MDMFAQALRYLTTWAFYASSTTIKSMDPGADTYLRVHYMHKVLETVRHKGVKMQR